jgi:hypothetical protein
LIKEGLVVEKQVYKVEDPVYLTKEEIQQQYWDKQVLLTNIEMAPDYSRMDGGVVRYYAIDSMDELWALLSELREIEGNEAIESCSVQYVGPIYMNLYAAGGSLS